MNESTIKLIFLSHLAMTLYMVGLIWFVQIVHYPLFDGVGKVEFPSYEQRHGFLTTWVVGPPMLIELITAMLLIRFCPNGVPTWSIWTGLALLVVIWLSTAFVQVPCHESLSRVFEADVHRRLVLSNWIRTAAWSLRGAIVLWMAFSAIR